MLTLDTLNVMLAVGEEGMIEEIILTLLASPQLAIFLKSSRGLKPPLQTISRAGGTIYAKD